MSKSKNRLLERLDEKYGEGRGDIERAYFCPYCEKRVGESSRKRKLYVNLITGKAFCFRCGWRVHNLEGMNRVLGGDEEISIPVARDGVKDAVLAILAKKPVSNSAPVELKRYLMPDEAVSVVDKWTEKRVYRAVHYLDDRGYCYDDALRFDIHYADEGEFAFRLLFPVYQFGEIDYHTNRATFKSDRKTLNPKNIEGHYGKSDCLLNFDNAVGNETVYIVEGPFDCMAFGENAVAIMGSSISDRQVALLRKMVDFGTNNFIVAMDADGYQFAVDIYDRLVGVLPSVGILQIDEGDPDSRRSDLSSFHVKHPCAVDRARLSVTKALSVMRRKRTVNF